MYDICIIGGGINGVSTALQCSERGYRVALFEQKQLGNGASSKTSKLAHGGLRYLQNLEFSLVRESVQERNKLLIDYPHQVKSLPFIFPVYNYFDTLKMWFGLKIYDILAAGSSMPNSYKTSITDCKHKLPWLDVKDVKSCFVYYDAVMYDKELIDVLAKKAALNFAEIYTNEKVNNVVNFSDHVQISTSNKTVESRVVIDVTGAWNKKLTSPSKGVHLVTNKLKGSTASILINPDDGRVFFTIPYRGNTIIGTTDELYDGDPDDLSVNETDRDYILNAINKFSVEGISRNDIIDEYVGLRPLAKSDERVGKISRDYIIDCKDRVFSMVGGKYTTHRAMCEMLTNKVDNFLN